MSHEPFHRVHMQSCAALQDPAGNSTVLQWQYLRPAEQSLTSNARTSYLELAFRLLEAPSSIVILGP